MQVEKEDLGKRASARKGLSNVTVGLGSSFKMFIWGNSVRVGFKGLKEVLYKGGFQKRFSGFCPLRGYPNPPLTENQCEKKKDFFLSGIGGYPTTVGEEAT